MGGNKDGEGGEGMEGLRRVDEEDIVAVEDYAVSN